ncbi:MAG: hypothetical protein SFV21_16950 [Rhodospirillaceae bacterium]|nr:hypothetical protein [Rhodospirillaceae bacterium]
MKALTHNRIELVEVYAELRAPLDDAALDGLVDRLIAAAAPAAVRRYGPGVEVLIHVGRGAARGSGRGVGATVRAAVQAASAERCFPRGTPLDACAADLLDRGGLFVRDLTAALAAAYGRRALGRTEHRRKAPGKIAALYRRIEPAALLKVSSMTALAETERGWLTAEIAGLLRSVHSPAAFARLMARIRRETGVGFLPIRPDEVAEPARRLVGVSDQERRLKRRRTPPRFAAVGAGRPHGLVAARLDGRSGAPAWFGD